MIDDLIRIDGDEVIRAGELDESGTRDVFSEIAALLDPVVPVAPGGA